MLVGKLQCFADLTQLPLNVLATKALGKAFPIKNKKGGCFPTRPDYLILCVTPYLQITVYQ